MARARGQRQFLLQMSGVPGSGKSTVAKMVGEDFGAVVLDHDVIKSTLLDIVPFADAGPASYRVLFAQVNDLLGQGLSVVIDSPCFYVEILQQGTELAQRHGASYGYVECLTPDLDAIEARLRGRTTLRSQRRSLSQPPADSEDARDGYLLFTEWARGMKLPTTPFLEVDTRTELAEVRRQVTVYLTDRLAGATRGPKP